MAKSDVHTGPEFVTNFKVIYARSKSGETGGGEDRIKDRIKFKRGHNGEYLAVNLQVKLIGAYLWS
jgi:hypothetical protein